MSGSFDYNTLLSLPDNEKIVQLCDLVMIQDRRLTALENMEDVDRTVAFGDDVANLKDVEDPPMIKKSPAKKPTRDPPKPPTSSKKKVWSAEELVLLEQLERKPFDPLKCRRRLFKGPPTSGYGCQCSKSIHENGLCDTHFNNLYGPKAKSKWVEKGTFPNGYYDDPRPSHDLIDGHKFAWHDAEKSTKSKNLKTLANIRKDVSDRFPDLDTSTMKKAELLAKLTEYQEPHPIEEGIPPQLPAQLPEDIPDEKDADWPNPPMQDVKPLPDLELDDNEYYEDVDYQGVTYLSKNDTLFTMEYEVIGTWDKINCVATFTTPEAIDYHETHRE